MANKIISFGNTQQKSDQSNTDSMVVFKDVSMTAKLFNKQKIIPQDFITLLKTEYKDIDEFLYDDIYTAFLIQYKDSVQPTPDHINKILTNLSIYKIDTLINVQAIQNSLHNIFSWYPGERILNPEFGSQLYTLLYEGITIETEERIMAEIRHSMSKWEPRVQLVSVRNISTIENIENNTIQLEIIYTIPKLSNEQYAYSFEFNRSNFN